MNTVYKNKNGEIIHGDNLEILPKLENESIDSCISDFPYAIEFMGKNWDSPRLWNTGVGNHPEFYTNTQKDTLEFYSWCYPRAEALYPLMKNGGYVAVFGHPKTNHRMKCAFEDVGFKVVEEIDWIYLTGMPKGQDIGKMFAKAAEKSSANNNSDLAKEWEGWKTSGLKPAHEPITVFQKPLEGTYIQNIEKYGCGGMNINACRIGISQSDIDMINAKASKNPTSNYSELNTKIYGGFKKDRAIPANASGRFPPNIVFDEYMSQMLDQQTGETKSCGGSGTASGNNRMRKIYNAFRDTTDANYKCTSLGGYGDVGGGSRLFPIIKYCPKVSPIERKLPNGERNPHVTLKPIELIKWLIKLLTPKDGTTIDITAGSCTHALACEQLNQDVGYNLKWINIELLNTIETPYCDVGKERLIGYIGAK